MLKRKWCSAWCCRWSSSVASKQSVSQCVKPPPPPAWIMQPPPTGRHRWTGLFHPQKNHYAKTTGKTQKYINEQCRWFALIDGQLMQLLWAIHTLPAEYEIPKVINRTRDVYECLLGFCFNNIFCAATNFGCIDSFLLPFRNEEMMGDGFLWCLLPVCLNSKRLLSTSCNRASAVASSIFSRCYSRCFFEVRRIVCEN